MSHIDENIQIIHQDNIQITVTKLPDDTDGLLNFQIEAQNTNDSAKRIELLISLNNRNYKEPAGLRGEMTVLLEIAANAESSSNVQCREKEPSNSWYATLIKIQDFAPENKGSKKTITAVTDSLTDMEKELDQMEKELDDL